MLALLAFGLSWWLPEVEHRGEAPYVENPGSYKVFRNVKDYGAVGDGKADDTAAFEKAMSEGGRCGAGCETTRSPALIYVPPGTYLVSGPIRMYYYTHLIGDVQNPPTIKATANFNGGAVIDGNFGTNPTLNFWKCIRNLIIDMRDGARVGIHWQIAQATSLNNLQIYMKQGSNQLGINQEEGSSDGGISDIYIEGGELGAQLGNQQQTMRNITIKGSQTAVRMSWDWDFNYIDWKIIDCNVGFDVDGNIASCVFVDCEFTGVDVAIQTSYADGGNSQTGTIVVDNCDFSGANVAVQRGGATLLAGKQKVDSWIAGVIYTNDSPTNGQGAATGTRTIGANPHKPVKPAALLGANGKFKAMGVPQFPDVAVANIVSVKAKGAKGDGKTDDTAALQAAFDSAGANDIILVDQGAYLVSDTVYIKPGSRIVGEAWPLFLAEGPKFEDMENPHVAFQVGKPGEEGICQMTDIVFSDKGNSPGSILVEWNLKAPAGQEHQSGMWEVHWRLCTGAGTDGGDAGDIAAFLGLHVTKTATLIVEGMWIWAGDHTEDGVNAKKFSGRGLLVESQGPVWLYGVGSEHHVLYQIQFANAANIFFTGLQTETAYWQGNGQPAAPKPFNSDERYTDPTFADCNGDTHCAKGWALRIVNSHDILVYGTGSYDFFDNMDQGCLNAERCQRSQVGVENSERIWLFDVNTKASDDIVRWDLTKYVPQGDNRNTFCSTCGLFYHA